MGRKLAEHDEVSIQQTTKRAEEVEMEREKMSERVRATQKEVEAISQSTGQEDLQALNVRLQQQITESKEEPERREELELYIKVQEETYADYLAKVEIAKGRAPKVVQRSWKRNASRNAMVCLLIVADSGQT